MTGTGPGRSADRANCLRGGVIRVRGVAPPGQPVWSPTTGYRPGAHAVVQNDCNFVIYDGDGKPLWSTATWGRC